MLSGILLLQAVCLFSLTAANSIVRDPSRLKRSTDQCFGDLGCFSNSAPFFSSYRPISFLPEPPSYIKPTFTLYTKEALSAGHLLKAGDVDGLRSSSFSASRPTKFIVHGFIDNGGTGWMEEMKNEFMTHGDYNVVLVNWGFGSMALYGQATANTRVVGAMIAQLIHFMQNVTGAQPENMHIIGHSLGSHVAGYAGERLKYLGRITGLDPAEPYFQYTDIRVRLDPSDALFVDIIHTDGADFYSTSHGFGMSQPCGHVDYFPNGGHDQPGCEMGVISHIVTEGLVTGAKEYVACNHLRSYHFFTESINSDCSFEAYQCDNEDHFNKGQCTPCSEGQCGQMGLNADRFKPPSGQTHVKYFLSTSNHAPYCHYHFKVSVDFGGTGEERGQMYVKLTGSRGSTQEIKVTPASVYVYPRKTYTYLVTSPTNLGEITNVAFRWSHDSELLDIGSWDILGLRNPKVYLNRITVANAETSISFCEHSVGVVSEHTQVLSTAC